jgi:hypothetical protein
MLKQLFIDTRSLGIIKVNNGVVVVVVFGKP